MTTGFHSQRVIFEDDTTLLDKTIELNDFRTGSLVFDYVTVDDILYIGSDLPFNSQYFDLSTVNAVAAVVSVDIWDGDSWNAAIDILDFTKVSGASLGRSGYVVFTPDLDNEPGWSIECDSEDITGLETTRIQDKYWARFKWDATLTPTTEIDYIGHKFSNDDELYSLYPDLNNTALLDAFAPGEVSGTKTDWNEQTYQAAQDIIQDLWKRNIIWSDSQILDFQLFKEASMHKTAQIIYSGLGGSQRDEAAAALVKYDTSKNLGRYNTDVNRDGQLTPGEKSIRTAAMSR